MWRPLWASGSLAGRRQAGGPAREAGWFVQPGACDPHPRPVLTCVWQPKSWAMCLECPPRGLGRTVPVGPAGRLGGHPGHRPAHTWRLSSPPSGVRGNHRARSRGAGTAGRSLPLSQPHSCLLSTYYILNPHHAPSRPAGTSPLCRWDLRMIRLSDEEVKLPTVPQDETRQAGAETGTQDPEFGLPSLWLCWPRSAAEMRVSPEKQRGTLSPMGLSLGLSPLLCQGTSHSFVHKGFLGTRSAQALCWGLEVQQGAIDNTTPLTSP